MRLHLILLEIKLQLCLYGLLFDIDAVITVGGVVN